MSCCDIEPKCTLAPIGGIVPFWGFSEFTPTIPKLYWNVKSQEQRILRICDMLDKMICYSIYLGENLGITREELLALRAEFEQFKSHGFDDYYYEQVVAWINEHMHQMLEALIHKQVFFGLTQDGYFCAYIPENWHEVWFDTGANYLDDDYGCLILKY